MSSDHTWIRNSEIADLRDAASRTYQAEQTARDIKARTEQREREIRSQYQSSITSLSSQINTISRQHDAELRRVSEDFRKNIARQATEFSRDIKELKRHMDHNFDDFRNRFNDLANREADKKRRAEAYITEMNDMLARVAALNPQKYGQGDYFNQMTDQLDLARNLFNQEDYEAAMGVASVRFANISALEQQLTNQKIEFDFILEEVREVANVLRSNIAMLADGKPVHSFTHNGKTITRPYDIDHWTNGRFNDFCHDMDEIERRLTTAEDNSTMGLEQLEGIRERLASWVGDDGYLRLLDEEGKQNQISSIAVDEMTARVFDALEEQGWRLVDSGRLNEDDRNGCSITYEDNVGNQVVLAVNPDKDDPTVTPIIYEVFANGEDNVESEYTRSIENGIRTTITRLQGGSIEHGRTEHRNDCHLNPTREAFVQNNVANIDREQAAHA